MARDGELQVVRLRNDFYKDGFRKAVIALSLVGVAIFLLLGIAVFIMVDKAPPVTFSTDNEWRVIPSVPLQNPYLASKDLIQWVSEAVPTSFSYDFVNYMSQLKASEKFFTSLGWEEYLNVLNNIASYNSLRDGKLFVNATAAGAPYIVNRGLLGDRYVWQVVMPVTLLYQSYATRYTRLLQVSLWIVRVPTLNNINGVGIEKISLTEDSGRTQNQ